MSINPKLEKCSHLIREIDRVIYEMSSDQNDGYTKDFYRERLRSVRDYNN